MSRLNLNSKVKGREVVVGLDRVLGFFVQVFEDPNKTNSDEEEMVVDKDQLTTHTSKSNIISIIKEHAEDDDLRNRAITLIALDMDPAKTQ